jgi:hypothetical protein
LVSEPGYHIPRDRMAKKGGSITLEMLWERIESIDASNKQTIARLEKIENSLAKNNQESVDRDRSEADLEARLLKSQIFLYIIIIKIILLIIRVIKAKF